MELPDRPRLKDNQEAKSFGRAVKNPLPEVLALTGLFHESKSEHPV
jgi:hypothetical protein